MKIAIYTSIYGDIDDLIEPKSGINLDFYVFSDKLYNSKIWNTILEEREYDNNILNYKRFKILPHLYLNNYDASIWIDGNVDIIDIKKFINLCIDKDLVFFNHNSTKGDARNCIYDEAEAIIKLKKSDKNIVINQINKYKKEKYPSKNGLICGGIIFRKHTELVNNLMSQWWDEIINNSYRDQLSFNYVAWKNNYDVKYIDKDIRNNEYFKIIRKHRNDKNI